MKNFDAELCKLKSAWEKQVVPESPSQLKNAVLRELKQTESWFDFTSVYFARAAVLSCALATLAVVTFQRDLNDTPDTELTSFFSDEGSLFNELDVEEENSSPLEDIIVGLS